MSKTGIRATDTIAKEGAALDVAIVGAGIAGLSAAFSLLQRGRARGVAIRPAIFDADDRAGGVIRTERVDGFVVESGPDCFITDKPAALRLCERLGLADDLIGTNPACRRSFILRGRRLVPIPDGFHLLAPARLRSFATTRALSLRGRLRAALDLVLPRGPEVPDESLASFVTRRFGAEVLERLAQPLLAGIYNADPEHLSLRATMPRFLDLERRHRSVIAGLRRGRRLAGGAGAGTSGARYSLFVAPRRGMMAIVERLLQEIPAEALRLGTRVTALRPAGSESGGGRRASWTVATSRGEQSFHAVVLALGAPQAAALVRPFDAGLADGLAATPYGSSTTVSLAYRETDLPRPLDGFGFVVPRVEKRSLIACSFSSVKFAERAPEGAVLLRAFTSEALVPGRDATRAIEAMHAQVRDILGVRGEPILARASFHPGSMAQYDVGHLERVAEIESRLGRRPGLALAGNGLRGVGVPDCIQGGEAAADRVLSQAPLLVP